MTGAYVNIHGQPIGVSARDAVIAIEPAANCGQQFLMEGWAVRRTSARFAKIIGTGANEEAAWRDAWSRLLVESMATQGDAA